MKITGFVGSPRRDGNTDTLVQQTLDGAAKNGADVKKFYINEMEFIGCQGCGHCKSHDRCKLDDDMQVMLDAILESDGIVIGSPIYFGQFTGQTRLFIDRLYSLINPDFSPRVDPGKKVVLVGSQGFHDKNQYKPVFEEFSDVVNKLFGMEVKDIIIGAGHNEPGDVVNNTELMNDAMAAGKNMLK